MHSDQLTTELESLEKGDYFSYDSEELVQRWRLRGTGTEAVEPILRFFEAYPDIDYGMPGPLVHYVAELLHYQHALLLTAITQSIHRRPTLPTTTILRSLAFEIYTSAKLNPKLHEAARRILSHPEASEVCKELAEGILSDFPKI